MKIAIVGSEGYIAGHLIRSLLKQNDVEELVKIDQCQSEDVIFMNLLEPEQFSYDILDNVDYVIFTAAISGPDQCAKQYDFCKKVNVDGTGYFIQKAIDHNCNVLFFSSDAVFSSQPNEIYDEHSNTNASTPYGVMKKTIEDQFKENPRFKAIRLSYVVSANDKFVSYCLNCIRQKSQAEIFHPFYRNCITVSDVIQTVLWLGRNWDVLQSFVLNITGIELVSRIRIADEINRLFDNQLHYTVANPDEDFFKNRPKITQMKSCYLYKYSIVPERTFTERIMEEMKEVEL
jgi:dTDP-4-dehydrorhamnose reductase